MACFIKKDKSERKRRTGGGSGGGSGKWQLIGPKRILVFAAAFGEAAFVTCFVLIVVCPHTSPPPEIHMAVFKKNNTLT